MFATASTSAIVFCLSAGAILGLVGGWYLGCNAAYRVGLSHGREEMAAYSIEATRDMVLEAYRMGRGDARDGFPVRDDDAVIREASMAYFNEQIRIDRARFTAALDQEDARAAAARDRMDRLNLGDWAARNQEAIEGIKDL